MKRIIITFVTIILGSSSIIFGMEVYDSVTIFIRYADTIKSECMSGDCINGKGVAQFGETNLHYDGDFKNGRMDGNGTLTNQGWSYTGQWEKGLMHGQGILTYEDGKTDEGSFLMGRYTGKCETGDCNSGKGTLTWADGKKYEGYVKDGMMDGTGTLTWDILMYPKGAIIYTGQFTKGLRNGQGTMTDPNNTYNGQWKDDSKNGLGTLESSGYTYKGEWKDNMMHGQGVMLYSDGSRDQGRFVKGRYTGKCEAGDCKNGKGTLTWATGGKYTGEIKDGMMNGTGTFICNNYTYTGQFRDGLIHGKGKFIGKKNDIVMPVEAKYDGEWKEGVLVKATGTITNYAGTYTGEFKNGKINGKGTMIFKNGSSYKGQWENEKMHGEGVYKYADGKTDSGNFKNDRFLGKCISGNCTNGKGTAIWSDGSKYTGEFIEGEKRGQGIMINADGSKYVGEFFGGQYYGKGTLTEKDGTVKTGLFSLGDYDGNCKKGDCENGYGEFDYADGTSYKGEWKDGHYNGNGTYKGNESKDNDPEEDYDDGMHHIYYNNSTYIGQWKDGQKDGEGLYTGSGGDTYDGQWKNDKKNGKGTMEWTDGYKYIGDWKDDKQDGLGIFYNYDGTISQQGRWKDGKFIGE